MKNYSDWGYTTLRELTEAQRNSQIRRLTLSGRGFMTSEDQAQIPTTNLNESRCTYARKSWLLPSPSICTLPLTGAAGRQFRVRQLIKKYADDSHTRYTDIAQNPKTPGTTLATLDSKREISTAACVLRNVSTSPAEAICNRPYATTAHHNFGFSTSLPILPS